MTGRPRIGSLCTGYGGIDQAAAIVYGGSVTWVSDNAPGPRILLEHRLPTVPNLGDLTAIDWAQVEPVEILTAGYPCQPFSVAGKRKGADDDRSQHHSGQTLCDAVQLLPTPDAGNFNDCESFDSWETRRRSNSLSGRNGNGAGTPIAIAVKDPQFGKYRAAIERWAAILERPAPDPTEPDRTGHPRLSPLFVEWMMGLAEGYVTGIPGLSRNAKLALLGNGVVPAQAAHAFRALSDLAA